jgi:NAD(P)-dependent dehydrogenase (short-subunit alcohol dehydrogenase family)
MADSFCLITGASSGIGRGVAATLSQERNVILHGRNPQRLAETASECSLAKSRSLTWTHDLTDVSGIAESLVTLMKREDVVIDTLVHCAGVVNPLPMRAIEPSIVQENMNVNLFSAMEIVRLLLTKKVNQSTLTNIVFISSIYSVRGAKGHSLYAAAKGALDSYMLSLAAELAPQVRVNSVLPGAIRTRMSAAAFRDPAFVARLEGDYLLGIGEVDDIAKAVRFLISADARWITGQKIIVDGGRTVR